MDTSLVVLELFKTGSVQQNYFLWAQLAQIGLFLDYSRF